jgi:hypothetical protein
MPTWTDEEWVLTNTDEAVKIATACSILSSLIALCTIISHLTNYTKPSLQRHIVRIIAVIPTYAMYSCLSLHYQHISLYLETVRDCYEAFVIYSFLQLLLAYLGGENSCVHKMEQFGALHHPVPLCWLTPMRRNVVLLKRCKQGVNQFVVLKPLLAIMSLVAFGAGLYHKDTWQWILIILYNGSYTCSLYSLLIFVLANQQPLDPVRPFWKFFAVKSVIITAWYQKLVLEAMVNSDEARVLWNDLILSTELVLFALIHAFAFPATEFLRHKAEKRGSELGGLTNSTQGFMKFNNRSAALSVDEGEGGGGFVAGSNGGWGDSGVGTGGAACCCCCCACRPWDVSRSVLDVINVRDIFDDATTSFDDKVSYSPRTIGTVLTTGIGFGSTKTMAKPI